ncbi:MAG: phenylalanine--tRNA ligase subunit beta [Chloroflexota bacterium]
MRIPVSWLKDYVDITLSPKELADKLTIAGMEVDRVEYIGVPGGFDEDRLVWDRELLIIGQILKVEQHPNADKLVLATVEYGADEPEVVVTGAPNIFQYIGQGDLSGLNLYTPFALEGAVVYDGHKEGQVKMKLKGKSLRGIHNRCMVCSAKELGLGEDHDGIMLFDAADLNLPELVPGTPIQDIFGDVVIDFEVIPNIARTASIIGVAREVAALTDQPLRYPSYEVVQEGGSIEGKVKITTENPELNPRFTAMVIEGVEQKESPLWMKRRLDLAGQRPINVVVDISNYVMLEMGQPNHTFDFDFLRKRADQYDSDGPVHIITRLAKEGEMLQTLDGKEREMMPFTILVTDPVSNLSIGGIMGGADSEINAGTTNVLLEAAAWNYMNIRRSSHSLKLNSEAGFRFSRGVHPSQALLGAKRAAELLRTLAGGTVAQGIIDYYPYQPEAPRIEVDIKYVQRWSGIYLSAETAKELLEKIEFEVEIAKEKETLFVTPPDHRIDIEGKHDIVEEICRMYGYDRIPETILSDVLPPQRANLSLEREMKVKDLLVKLGLQEIITYRLTTPEREGKLLVGGKPDDHPYVTLQNTISADRVAMRHNLLASVAEIAADNSRHASRIAMFEVGKIYLPSEEGILPDELTRLSIVMSGAREKGAWSDPNAPAQYDFFDIKGVVEDLISDLHVNGFGIEAGSHPSFRPGRTAKLTLNNKQLGWIGELHPLVINRLGFRNDAPVLAADIDLDRLLRKIKGSVRFEPISPFPAITEDLAIVADKGITASQVEAVIEKAGGFLLKKVELFDVYEGESIPGDKRSLAYHLTFQSPSKTLKDKDVAKLRNKIVGQLKNQLNATIRA